jgi:hypothetical protein
VPRSIRVALDVGESPWRPVPTTNYTKFFSDGWGSLEFVLGDDDVVRLLSVAIKREGGQVAFAKHHRINRTYLNMVLRRKRPVGDAVTEALGLHKVYTLK